MPNISYLMFCVHILRSHSHCIFIFHVRTLFSCSCACIMSRIHTSCSCTHSILVFAFHSRLDISCSYFILGTEFISFLNVLISHRCLVFVHYVSHSCFMIDAYIHVPCFILTLDTHSDVDVLSLRLILTFTFMLPLRISGADYLPFAQSSSSS